MKKTLSGIALTIAMALSFPVASLAVTNDDLTISDIATLVSNTNVSRIQVDTDPETGNSLVVYTDGNDSNKLKGVIFDSELSPVGSPFVVFNFNQGSRPAAIEWNPDEDLWLVGTYDGNFLTKVVPVSADGTVGSVLTAMDSAPNGDAVNDLEVISISYSPELEKFLVAVKANLPASSNCEVVLGVFISSDAATTSGPAGSRISTNDDCAHGVDNGSALTYSPVLQKWLLGYYTYDNGSAPSFDDMIYVNLVGGTAQPESAGEPVAVGANTSSGSPTLTYNSDKDEFFATWATDGVNDYYSRGGFIDGDGLSSSGAFDLIPDGVAPGPKPRTIYNEYSNLYFTAHYVWDSFDGSSSSDNVVLTVVNEDGTVNDPVLLSDGNEGAVRPDITNVGDCTVVVWSTSGTGVRAITVCGPEGDDAAELASTGVNVLPFAAVATLLLAVGAAIFLNRERKKA